MSEPTPRPAGPSRIRTAIRAYDLDRSLEFYRDLLGLPVISQWDHEGGGCLLAAGPGPEAGLIELLGKPPEMKSRGGWDFIPPTAKLDLILEVPDVDIWHAHVVAAGAEPQSAPVDTAWGGRWFTLLDPDETPVVFLSMKAK
jgi:catechol 2,3-dioxygenase-like lactoylglutathione lyase family enzyme